MPHFVTSAQKEDHVTSENAALLNAGIVGNGQYLLDVADGLAATMVDSNTLRILKGDALVNGRQVSIDGDYEEYTIENGTPGMNRIDLAVFHIETSPVEKIDIRVLKGEETSGTAVEPTFVEGDLNDGDTVVEVPICSVPISGINPGEPVAKLEKIGTLSSAWDSIYQNSEDIKALPDEIFCGNPDHGITSGDDLNNFTKAGTYNIGGNGASVANWPTTFAGMLIVLKPFGPSQRYTIQIVFDYRGKCWVRGYGNNWSGWTQVA